MKKLVEKMCSVIYSFYVWLFRMLRSEEADRIRRNTENGNERKEAGRQWDF